MYSRFLHTLVFVLLACFFCNKTYSQNPYLHYAYNFGSNSTDNGQSIVTDNAGNVYVTGYFTGTTDFDPGPGVTNLVAAGTDLNTFVAKFTLGGTFQWAFSIPNTGTYGEGRGVAVDGAGNIFVGGSFTGSADFDPGAGTATLTSNGSSDIYVAKYNSNGNYLWAINMGGIEADFGNAIALDVAGNVYVTGDFANTTDFDPGAGSANLTAIGTQDLFLAKYNSSGVYQWAFNIGRTTVANDGLSVAVDAASNVYVTGTFYSVIDFDPGAGTSNLYSIGANDVFLAKYNSAGIYQWAFNIGGGASDVGYDVAVAPTGEIYLSGYFQGPADFDPDAVANAYDFGKGAFLAKYTAAGQFIWEIPINYTGVGTINIATSIATDINGNVLITGRFSGTADFDPGAGTLNLTASGPTDIFIAKYSDLGTIKWAFGMGGSSVDVGLGIATDAFDGVYITGNFQGTADFDPHVAVSNLISNSNSSDIFIARYSPCPASSGPGPITGPTSVCAGSTNTYSIDPVPGAFFYTWTLPSGWSGASITNSINTTAFASGTISVVSNNVCGPSYSVNLPVTVSPVMTAAAGLFVDPQGPICQGKPAKFTVTNIGTATPTNYDFRINGVSQQSGPSDTYINSTLANGDVVDAIVTVSGTCLPSPTITTNSIVANVLISTPTVTITASRTGPVCVGTFVQFNVSASNLSGGVVTDYSFKVHGIINQTGTDPTFNWISPYGGDVSARITVAGSKCLTKDTASSNIIQWQVDPIPVISFNPPQLFITQGGSAVLNANVSTPGTYLWTPSTGLSDPTSLNPIASPLVTTDYELQVITPTGCAAVKQTKVNVYKDIYIPNSFVPEGNSPLNRVFKISSGTSLKLEYFKIFDRLGNTVFATANVNEGWDGNYKGKPASSGVYVYVIKGSDITGERLLKGTVMLIR